MTYSFRLRFTRCQSATIQSDENKLSLAVEGAPESLRLANPKPEGALKDAERYAFSADGFSTEEEAHIAGLRLQAPLSVALARHRIGANFGARAPKSFFTKYGLEMIGAGSDVPILNDVHGLMTFKTEPKPLLASMEGGFAFVGYDPDQFRATFAAAVKSGATMTERHAVAFQLFNDSFFHQTVESRFLLLMMAIEALLELRDRDAAALAHVNSLIEQTKSADIPEAAKLSFLGSLRWLRQESISHAGSRLASEILGERTYLEKSPAKFFKDCYGLRSSLVHGSHPHSAGTVWPRRCGDDHDLHPCTQDGRRSRTQPPGFTVQRGATPKLTLVNFRSQPIAAESVRQLRSGCSLPVVQATGG